MESSLNGAVNDFTKKKNGAREIEIETETETGERNQETFRIPEGEKM